MPNLPFEYVQRGSQLNMLMEAALKGDEQALVAYYREFERRDRDLEDFLAKVYSLAATGGAGGGGDATDFTNTTWKLFGNAVVSGGGISLSEAWVTTDPTNSEGVAVWDFPTPLASLTVSAFNAPNVDVYGLVLYPSTASADADFYDATNHRVDGLTAWIVFTNNSTGKIGLYDYFVGSVIDQGSVTLPLGNAVDYTYDYIFSGGTLTVKLNGSTQFTTSSLGGLPASVKPGFLAGSYSNFPGSGPTVWSNLANLSF